MKRRLYFLSALIVSGFAFYIISCNSSEEKKENEKTTGKAMTPEELIKRGDYIVTTSLCNDCHSPKKFTKMRPEADSSKLLSGHPANDQLPPIETKSLKPGNWVSLGPDLTSYIGPWGISYSSNLTPDTATGIGLWTEAEFISTLRNGKHQGNGRDLLPPMPWNYVGKMTDEDLKAVFAYLKSLPAVNNRVPAPIPPPEVEKMAAKK